MSFTLRTSLLASCFLVSTLGETPLEAGGSGAEYELFLIEPWNTGYALATSSASGINNSGQVSGAATPLSGSASFLWTVEGGKQQINLAGRINDQGVIAGANAVRWLDGTIEVFDLLSVAEDINDQNTVAGTWGTTTCGLSTTDEAGIWDQANGTRLLQQDFGIVAAEHARAVNDQGELVGVRSVTGTCGDFQAFYLDVTSGQVIDIHVQLLGSTLGKTEVFDLSDMGFVVGEGPHDGTVKPFLWHRLLGFQFLPAPSGGVPLDTHFASLNSRNEAVGAALVGVPGTGGLREWRAIVWDAARGTRDLNSLVEAPSNFVLDAAKEINDEGWIIGSGHYGSWSPERAFVLVPKAPGIEPRMSQAANPVHLAGR